MNGKTISHARALRVIGQYLGDLGVIFFQISKEEQAYIVVTHDSASVQKPVSKPALSSSRTDKARKPQRPQAKAAGAIRFATSDIPGLDIRARGRRTAQAGMVNLVNLAAYLRVLGGYLDRKQVDEFTLSWRIDSVIVATHEQEHVFSVHQNLYDLGVPMYLNRSRDIADTTKRTAT